MKFPKITAPCCLLALTLASMDALCLPSPKGEHRWSRPSLGPLERAWSLALRAAGVELSCADSMNGGGLDCSRLNRIEANSVT